jgi:hypothetical protein
MKNSFNLPSKKEIKNIYKNYKLVNSEAQNEILKYNNKVYEDPESAQAESKSLINYSFTFGKNWIINTYTENNLWHLEISNKELKSSDTVTLVFPTFDEMVSFAKNIYSEYPIGQSKSGIDVENIVIKKSLLRNISIATAGVSLFYLLVRKRGKNDR